jgi:hypothetical protein
MPCTLCLYGAKTRAIKERMLSLMNNVMSAYDIVAAYMACWYNISLTGSVFKVQMGLTFIYCTKESAVTSQR